MPEVGESTRAENDEPTGKGRSRGFVPPFVQIEYQGPPISRVWRADYTSRQHTQGVRLTVAVLITFILTLGGGGWHILPVAMILFVLGASVPTVLAILAGLALLASNVTVSARTRAVLGVLALLGLCASLITLPMAMEYMQVYWITAIPFGGFALWHILHLIATIWE